MMATKLCSNWETLQHLNPDMCFFQQKQTDLANEMLGFWNNFGTSNPNLIDPYFEPDDFLFAETNTQFPVFFPGPEPEFFNPLDSFWPENTYSLPPENYPTQEWECSYNEPSLKRLRSSSNCYYSDSLLNPFDGCVGNSLPVSDFSQELMFSSPAFQSPSVFSDAVQKSSGVSLSPQSVAARQRRKKISEKTQELGKIIPGGNKMNTAEMLRAAFNYVKFLQAEVAVLGLVPQISSQKETTVSPNYEELLQVLVTSPTIQEKLYEDEKCIVPTKLIKSLSENPEVQANPTISKDLTRLLQSLRA